MKATYFYSEKQKQAGETRSLLIEGKEYTEVKTGTIQTSNWNDAVVVEVKEKLPVDDFILEHLGELHAKT